MGNYSWGRQNLNHDHMHEPVLSPFLTLLLIVAWVLVMAALFMWLVA